MNMHRHDMMVGHATAEASALNTMMVAGATRRGTPVCGGMKPCAPAGSLMAAGRNMECGLRGQRGLVMLMTLVLLVVMALGTAVSMRLSLTTDMVGANLRARSLAFQSAEAALRYCEKKVIDSKGQIPMLVGYRGRKDGQEWMDERQWSSIYSITVEPRDLNLSFDVRGGEKPQCLFRHMTIDEWREVAPPQPGTVTAESRGFDTDRFQFYRITAKGYSPDYKTHEGTDYQTARGSEVRLQSMVRAIK